MARTITSANSILTLTVPGLFPAPVQIQQFDTDQAFDSPGVNPVEVRKGVDAKKSSGYTPYMPKTIIHLMADSASIDFFDNWRQAMDAAREDFPCNGSILIPSLSKLWTMTNGSITDANIIPSARKVLEGQAFEITWDSITIANAVAGTVLGLTL